MSKCNVEKLVEFARIGSPLDRALGAHIQVCETCHSRFDAERVLTRAMASMRVSETDMRSSAASRQALMDRFDNLHLAPANHRWLWSLAAAAVLIIGTGLVNRFPAHTPPARLVASAPEYSAWLDAGDSRQAEAQEDGFIAVPYVPPLAAGELVRVIHTELDPAALASLGVNVDPTWTALIPADLLVTEDGSPRAVRLTEGFERTI